MLPPGAGVVYAQPVSHGDYSNVHPCHLGRCNDVSTEFFFIVYDVWNSTQWKTLYTNMAAQLEVRFVTKQRQ
jgi:hypothetical protein